MTCEQALFAGYTFAEDPIRSFESDNVVSCSQACCDEGECLSFSFDSDTKICKLFPFPDVPIYLPLPSTKAMVYSGDQNQLSGVLMKRKISTWVPWLIGLILIALLLC